ncbi:cell division protein FtsQ [Bifidobacterium xylocopae]|uniref:Cell division protein FtsQ n=2 Tax=Bifidobacterium xylocopae TaxID=2493119 RepID=A0A366KBS6_9BIFI|nr:cell division protein FtsQ [Bifidobacterium xylocopae]
MALSHRSRRTSGRSRSGSGDFVDARSLKSDDAILRTMAGHGQGPGVFVKPKVVDFKARLQERKRASLRVRLIRWGIGLLSLALVVGLTWLLCFSPALVLQAGRIHVTGGNQWVSNQEIADIVRKEDGRSLVLISTGGIESSISALPGVTSAKASKRFPHGMDVDFKAQEPAAVLKAASGKITAVDRDGRILNAVGASSKGIPQIEVSTLEQGISDQAVKQALKILAALPEPMRRAVTKVSAKTQDSVTTELDGGQRIIVWGDASDLKLKMAVVDKIVNDPTKIGDKHQVDVSAPLRPIIK